MPEVTQNLKKKIPNKNSDTNPSLRTDKYEEARVYCAKLLCQSDRGEIRKIFVIRNDK
jgi:hypothetical protein